MSDGAISILFSENIDEEMEREGTDKERNILKRIDEVQEEEQGTEGGGNNKDVIEKKREDRELIMKNIYIYKKELTGRRRRKVE